MNAFSMVNGFTPTQHGAMQPAKNDLFQELTILVGDGAAHRIVTRFGGRTILFRSVRKELAMLIGQDAAMVLLRHFRWVPTYIPKCSQRAIEARNDALLARFDVLAKTHSARATVALLAEEFRLSDRRVWNILKKTREGGQ